MKGREIVFYLCLIVVGGALGSAFPFLIKPFMEGDMLYWFTHLQPWKQMALCIPALCLLFCLYYFIMCVWGAWKLQAQAEQDRRAFVTRFRNGGPDEID